MLGPYVWMDVEEEELEAMLGHYRLLMEDEKNRELLKTLKVYLENNMNFSITAEKMYVHINTIRKRISKVKELLDVSLEDRISRLKTEMLLQFLEL
ncbi:helix-turn-helix domain-containing protein [Blautia obeum]|uniref:helix-turn-helix domain-containing protein n=2 Tax=Lachnospiraceae TaxID=186803 RepID=UPI003CFE0A79